MKQKLRLKKKYRNFKQLRYFLIRHNKAAELGDYESYEDKYFDVIIIGGKKYNTPKKDVGTMTFGEMDVKGVRAWFGRPERA